MDDALLVRMLHALADLHEQLQAVLGAQPVPVAMLGDRDTAHELHGEVGPALLGRPGVEDAGNVGMVHQGQGLALGLEAGDDLLGVHAALDQLERDLAPHRLALLGGPDLAHPAFAELLHKTVGADRSESGNVFRKVLGLGGLLLAVGRGEFFEPLLHQAGRAQSLRRGRLV